jgi:hypothetical protein
MTTILLITVALIGLWLFGGIAVRLLGIIAVATGLLQALAGQDPGALLLLPVGLALWLAGHWHYLLRHRVFKSVMAERILARRPVEHAGPDRELAIEPAVISPRHREVDAASAPQRSAIWPT